MSILNQEAPPAPKPKETTDYIRFEPLPEAGPTIMTIVAFNFLPNYEFEKDDGTRYNADAIEFFFGTEVGGKAYFVKTWPKTYSINEKAFYHKLYKAALGKAPVAGSKPAEIIGQGVSLTIELENKKSKKGKEYTACKIKGDAMAVHPKLKGEVVPLATLRPALDKALSAAPEEQKGDGNPF